MSEIVPVIRDGMEHRIIQLAESFARRIRSFVVRSAILGEEARPRHGTRSFCSVLSRRRCTRRTEPIGCSAALSVRIGVFVTKSRNHDYTGVFRLSTLARKLLQPRSGVESNVAIHILLQLRHLGNRLRLHIRRQHEMKRMLGTEFYASHATPTPTFISVTSVASSGATRVSAGSARTTSS